MTSSVNSVVIDEEEEFVQASAQSATIPSALPAANELQELVEHRVALSAGLSGPFGPHGPRTRTPGAELTAGAKGGTRTPTGVNPQDPESCASTKSATFAVFRSHLDSSPDAACQ